MSRDHRRATGRWVLAVFLIVAGVAHLGPRRTEFRAQVPSWVPLDTDAVVVVSGIVEVVLGISLIVLSARRARVGWVVAGFFVAVFPGNIAQFVDRIDAFGLDSDVERFVRLLFQPVLVMWALWSTGAWSRRRQPVG